jgi:hypothetical protein
MFNSVKVTGITMAVGSSINKLPLQQQIPKINNFNHKNQVNQTQQQPQQQ